MSTETSSAEREGSAPRGAHGRPGSASLSLARRAQHLPRAALVGLIAGLVAVAFRHALQLAEESRVSVVEALRVRSEWALWLVPLAAAALIGAVVWVTGRWAPESAGSGIPNVKGVLLNVRTLRWPRVLLVKFLGGVIGIGAGLSLGREGPTVQMGAAVGLGIGRLLRVRSRTLPQLISCGAGAGLAAAFNAPLAGFIFVLEELQREMSALTFGGALVAAVCATVVTAALAGQEPSFAVRDFPHLPLAALPLVALLGAAGGLVGVLFNQSLLAAQRFAHHAAGRTRVILVLSSGLVVGVLVRWAPDVVGTGHAVAERVLRGELVATTDWLVVLLIGKLVVTVVSYATGAPGGIFAPMLLMGALLGAAFGRSCALVAPSLAEYPEAFAVLGMAAFFTASVRAPLTGIVLILEMTGNQQQLFALCIVCLAAWLVTELLRDRPIYEALLDADLTRSGASREGVEPASIALSVQHGSAVDGRTIRDAGLPRGCLIVSIERGSRDTLPHADLVLRAGDHVTVLIPHGQPELGEHVSRRFSAR